MTRTSAVKAPIAILWGTSNLLDDNKIQDLNLTLPSVPNPVLKEEGGHLMWGRVW